MDTVGVCLLVCICVTHVIPMITLAWTVFNTSPYTIFPRRLITARQGDRSLIFRNFNDFLRMNNDALRRFLGKYALAACTFHLLIIIIFVLFLHYDMDLPFFPKLSMLLPEGVLDEYTNFSVICGTLQALPIIALVFVLYYNKRLPFTSELTEESQMTRSDLSSLEEISEEFGSIRLSCFEDSKKYVIFANCKDHRGRFLKLAFYQDKGKPKKTECYRIQKKGKPLEKLDPPPFNIHALVNAFEEARK